jgi:Cu+-exporting ATPase
VTLGNQAMMDDAGVTTDVFAVVADEMRTQGQTVMYVAADGALAGVLGVADPIKQSTPQAVKMLQEDGIRIVMVTGDSQRTAQAVAQRRRHRAALAAHGATRVMARGLE